MSTPGAYDHLLALSRERQILQDVGAVLSWDQEVILPPKGVPYRADQMAALSGWLHEKLVAPAVGGWLEEAESVATEEKDAWRLANIREWRREYDRATKLPQKLVEELSAAQVRAKTSWVQARRDADFSAFAPDLATLVELTRRKAGLIGGSQHPYDALVDEYEPGATTGQLSDILSKLRQDLVATVGEALETKPFDRSRLGRDFPVEKQMQFNREVAESIGFDFEAGRIDTTVHPFCSGMGPYDVRLTTRYDETDFLSSLFGVLHEAGHGLYEQGLPLERRMEPVGHAVSLGVHESQSRLWENHVGRSLPFWEKWLPRAVHYFPCLAGLEPGDLYEAVNQARFTPIRVEADEVTYDLHILLRFEIERALFSSEIEVDDIPAVWNERFATYFGTTVRDDAEGCLQDIHWSMGGFGYFATYSLGNLNAAHLMEQTQQKETSVARGLESGDYLPLLQWLRQGIHAKGSLLSPRELIEQAAGAPVDPGALIRHLRKRYVR